MDIINHWQQLLVGFCLVIILSRTIATALLRYPILHLSIKERKDRFMVNRFFLTTFPGLCYVFLIAILLVVDIAFINGAIEFVFSSMFSYLMIASIIIGIRLQTATMMWDKNYEVIREIPKNQERLIEQFL